MHHPAEDSPLGKISEYVCHYAPELLYPISRATKWEELGLQAGNLPYQGVDYWNCYELSWLTPSGVPVVAVGQFAIAANSPNIIESKSFKLYLNSLNQSRYSSKAEVEALLVRDLSACAQAPVAVRLLSLDEVARAGFAPLAGQCVDDLEVVVQDYSRPRPELLRCNPQQVVSETLYSHLLKSNCPVTGQPDWGSLVVEYQGARLDPASLLAYVVSFRQHQDFHEQCVERVFMDLLALLKPEKLTVYARYVRRGGLDINPYRSTEAIVPDNLRWPRQ